MLNWSTLNILNYYKFKSFLQRISSLKETAYTEIPFASDHKSNKKLKAGIHIFPRKPPKWGGSGEGYKAFKFAKFLPIGCLLLEQAPLTDV